ncbi:TPA: hypothetical protein PI395_002415 [Staphylococcus aureus]|nr:hypothetical protein [Staphylococcus aureus]HDH4249265.1 hypothetical protein [Staphylococcus aureus]HDH4409475.1 hypothetical protein [Staphylococcus aureus]HDH4519464.1 hypothetical protein [Staphylococcus aureus]HDH4529655.1 hypothetical protein [Staphylococcus aureus]
MSKEIFMKYSKIIVFDIDTALDMLDQENEGRLEYFERTTKSKAFKLLGDVLGGLNKEQVDVNMRAIMKLEFDKHITKELTNTVKTDFISKIESKINDFNLKYIQDYNLYILEGTTTYLKTLVPVTKVIKDFSKLQNGNEFENIEFTKMEELIDEMKSYHEFVAYKANSYKIIRVNPKHLRSDYKLSDLRNMKMNIVGVVIGETTINDIMFDAIMESDDQKIEGNLQIKNLEDQIDNINSDRKSEKYQNNIKLNNFDKNKKVEIIDVIIAGIK